MMNKEAQAWGFDLMIASVLFLTAMVIFYLYSLNYPSESQDALDTLKYEGDFIAESILSEGYPMNWNKNSVIKIGITNGNKINETKIEAFYNLANYDANPSGYAKAKLIFSTQYDFFFNLSQEIQIEGSAIPEGGIGRNFVNENPQNVIKITRLTIYQEKPATMNLYIWE